VFSFVIGRVATLATFAALLTAVIACGSTPVAPTATPTVPPTPVVTQPPSAGPTAAPSPVPTGTPEATGAALLLEVTSEGGFINPSARIGQLPTVVVDTDGKIYTPSGDVSGALIPVVDVHDVGEAGAAQIIQAIRDAGLDQEGDSGGIVADSGVTVFTVDIDGQEIVNRIGANGPGQPGQPGGGNNPAIDLLNRLTDPTETWGDVSAETSTYEPVAYRVYTAPAASGGGETVDWPLSTPLTEFGTPATPDFGVSGLRSGIVTGDDAATIADALSLKSSQDTVVYDGHPYQLWVRPLLPDELN